jgi:acyl carrier protein
MNVTKEQVWKVIEEAGVSADIANIAGDRPLKAAGVDSLEMMNIFLAVEEKFDIKIADEEINKLNSVDEILAYLNSI